MLTLVKKPSYHSDFSNSEKSYGNVHTNKFDATHKFATMFANSQPRKKLDFLDKPIFETDKNSVSKNAKTIAKILQKSERVNDFGGFEFNLYNSKTQIHLEKIKNLLEVKPKFYTEIESRNFIFVSNELLGNYDEIFVKDYELETNESK